jgi:cyclic pyranopterin phosphate synthase
LTSLASRRACAATASAAIDYLRISLTDHCNLRCVYCMPETGLTFLPSAALLSPDEIELVARAAVSVGFRKIRLTGGEPTLRADLLDVVARLAAVPGLRDLALTTNGVLLPKLAQPLRRAGLRRVNVHLDSLDPSGSRARQRWGTPDDLGRLTGRRGRGLRADQLNAVVAATSTRTTSSPGRAHVDRGWHVRFVETMPFGAATSHARDGPVPSAELRRRIEAVLGPPAPRAAIAHPPPRGRGVLGFISPVTEPYCGTCNRMRLTADGRFHLCLLNDDEMDVRGAIRGGGGIAGVADILLRAVAHKPTGHRLAVGHTTADRQMFQIGG